MKTYNSINELNIPAKLNKFLKKYLVNISHIPSIDRIILFGSCAKGYATADSDIDLLILGDSIDQDAETEIFCSCIPDVPPDEYVSIDIIVSTHETYDKHKTRLGYVERQIERDGIDVSGYITDLGGVIV